jgi:hypothetical protein
VVETTFQYSILQYKHSIVLGEAINIGIVFHFPTSHQLHFIYGNNQRVRAIYPDFDGGLFNFLLKNIDKRLKFLQESLFKETIASVEFSQILKTSLLPEDATVLQFTAPASGLNSFGDNNKLAEEFAKFLLPGIETKKAEIIRHTEHFLTKRFSHYILDKNKDAISKIQKDYLLKTEVDNNPVEIKFDFAWHNQTFNLVKPISFDLGEEKSIQDKAALNIGYLNLLESFAISHDARFDLLISKPQNKGLFKAFDSAIGLIDGSTSSPKRFIFEDKIEDYSEEALLALSN